ncbi:hypothetical protein, partial [Bradyrhizobium sp. 87]|uniref:hypothetical protein n=1 Tax=Bradyrhizobium sp. 87 TaxID=2782682 RepID=UPI001FF97A2C
VYLAQTLSPKLPVRRYLYRRHQQEKAGGMSIAFRMFVLLSCAYAGWETPSIHSANCENLSNKGVLQPDK